MLDLASATRVALGLAVTAAPASLIAVVAVAVLAAVVPLSTVWLTKLVLDELTGRQPAPGRIAALAGGLALTGVTAVVLSRLAAYQQAEVGRRVGLLAQDRLYTAVNGYAGLDRFENPHFLDRLRLAQQCGQDTPGQIVASGLALVRAVITTAGFLASLLVINPWMAAVIVIAAGPTLVAEMRLSAARARTMLRTSPLERREFFYANLLATVEAAKEVRLFQIGDFLRMRMATQRRAINRLRRAVDRQTLAVQGILGVAAAAVSAAGLFWAVLAAAHGTITIGDVSLFIAAVAATQSNMATVVGGLAMFNQHLVMFEHYQVVTRAGSDLPSAPQPRVVPRLTGGIELRDVWFRYSPKHPWILRGVNAVIPCGRPVALVGVNGAGKSTVVKLLCRFYDPTAGVVLWDGIDLRELDINDLRDHISAIFQDFMHYELSAAENVGLGDIERAEDRAIVEAAVRRVGLHDTIAGLPQGYDTMLTRSFLGPAGAGSADAGIALSGGQRQRLAVARAYLRGDRDLLILDEPSAGLDAEAEHEIHSGLSQYRSGRTSLLISHRLGAVRDAAMILVLRDGVVAEQGTHDELMRIEGNYARLFTLQAAGYASSSASASA